MNKLSNVNLVETNEPYNKVLYWFFSFPDANIGLNELCRQTRISKSNANRIVSRLEKEGFLIKEIIGKSWRIKCNKKHIFNFSNKIAFNLQMIYKSRLIEVIHKKFPGFQAIIIFGSYRKGDDIDKSDIDIAIQTIGNKSPKIEELGIIKKFGYRNNIKINLYLFSNNNLNKNLFSNIVNGIVLDGHLEI